jgi:hypothetical protein
MLLTREAAHKTFQTAISDNERAITDLEFTVGSYPALSSYIVTYQLLVARFKKQAKIIMAATPAEVRALSDSALFTLPLSTKLHRARDATERARVPGHITCQSMSDFDNRLLNAYQELVAAASKESVEAKTENPTIIGVPDSPPLPCAGVPAAPEPSNSICGEYVDRGFNDNPISGYN